MSRSNKGPSKAKRGHEYWGRRGYPNVRMATPGRDAKTETHRVERRQAKAEIVEQLHDEPDCGGFQSSARSDT